MDGPDKKTSEDPDMAASRGCSGGKSWAERERRRDWRLKRREDGMKADEETESRRKAKQNKVGFESEVRGFGGVLGGVIHTGLRGG